MIATAFLTGEEKGNTDMGAMRTQRERERARAGYISLCPGRTVLYHKISQEQNNKMKTQQTFSPTDTVIYFKICVMVVVSNGLYDPIMTL